MRTMPALPAVPKVVKTILRYGLSAAADLAINHLFMEYSGTAPTDSELSSFCAGVFTSFGSNIANLFSPEVTLAEVTAEDLSSSTGAIGSSTLGSAGSRAGGYLGSGSTSCIRLEIARRYRGGHPRIYAPCGVLTDLVDANQWSTAYQTAAVSQWANFI